MKHLRTVVLTALIMTILSSLTYGVTTRYINDFRFDNLDNIDASNVSIIENGGIELARSYEVILRSPDILWDIENWKNGFLCTAGDTAALLYVTDRTNYPVFISTNHVLFSDILIWNGHIYLTALPKASIFKLDEGFHPLTGRSLTNEYLWQIVPSGNGLVLLAGNPAAVYLMDKNGNIDLLATVPTEDNLIKGLIFGNDLLFIGDGNTLYRLPLLKGKRNDPVALASFDNTIADILYHNGRIYLITAPKDSIRSSSTGSASGGGDDESSRSSSQDKRSSRNTGGRSALYVYQPDGTTSEIFSRNNIRFISLNVIGDFLIVGIDRNAGYYEVPLEREGKKRFTGLGKGKFARFVSSGNDLYGVLLEPSRIVKIGRNFSAKGYFISSPFDTGNNSIWGSIDPSIDLLPGTDIRIFTRSGAVQNEDLWDVWQPVNDKLSSLPNRFFQYRIELSTSDGKNTPVFRNMTVPYVQNNIPPRIDKISFSMNNPGVYKISWDGYDENKDILIYDVFMAKKEDEWIQINDKPLEESSMEIQFPLFPDGKYRLKISASDERSNPLNLAKRTFMVSDPFIIDSNPPALSDIKTAQEGKNHVLRFTASDSLSDLFDASYSINGGKWIKFLPVKGLFDSKNASFELRLRQETPFTVQVRIADMFGNASMKGTYFGN